VDQARPLSSLGCCDYRGFSVFPACWVFFFFNCLPRGRVLWLFLRRAVLPLEPGLCGSGVGFFCFSTAGFAASAANLSYVSPLTSIHDVSRPSVVSCRFPLNAVFFPVPQPLQAPRTSRLLLFTFAPSATAAAFWPATISIMECFESEWFFPLHPCLGLFIPPSYRTQSRSSLFHFFLSSKVRHVPAFCSPLISQLNSDFPLLAPHPWFRSNSCARLLPQASSSPPRNPSGLYRNFPRRGRLGNPSSLMPSLDNPGY